LTLLKSPMGKGGPVGRKGEMVSARGLDLSPPGERNQGNLYEKGSKNHAHIFGREGMGWVSNRGEKIKTQIVHLIQFEKGGMLGVTNTSVY